MTRGIVSSDEGVDCNKTSLSRASVGLHHDPSGFPPGGWGDRSLLLVIQGEYPLEAMCIDYLDSHPQMLKTELVLYVVYNCSKLQKCLLSMSITNPKKKIFFF
jgi:hypothetical protein